MIAYKAVHKIAETFMSCVVFGQAETSYRIGKRTEVPKWLESTRHFPLLFESPDQVLDFIVVGAPTFLPESYVLECEVNNRAELPSFCYIPHLSDGVSKVHPGRSFPEGTVSYENVIPTKAYPFKDFALLNGWEYRYIRVAKNMFLNRPTYRVSGIAGPIASYQVYDLPRSLTTYSDPFEGAEKCFVYKDRIIFFFDEV